MSGARAEILAAIKAAPPHVRALAQTVIGTMPGSDHAAVDAVALARVGHGCGCFPHPDGSGRDVVRAFELRLNRGLRLGVTNSSTTD